MNWNRTLALFLILVLVFTVRYAIEDDKSTLITTTEQVPVLSSTPTTTPVPTCTVAPTVTPTNTAKPTEQETSNESEESFIPEEPLSELDQLIEQREQEYVQLDRQEQEIAEKTLQELKTLVGKNQTGYPITENYTVYEEEGVKTYYSDASYKTSISGSVGSESYFIYLDLILGIKKKGSTTELFINDFTFKHPQEISTGFGKQYSVVKNDKVEKYVWFDIHSVGDKKVVYTDSANNVYLSYFITLIESKEDRIPLQSASGPYVIKIKTYKKTYKINNLENEPSLLRLKRLKQSLENVYLYPLIQDYVLKNSPNWAERLDFTVATVDLVSSELVSYDGCSPVGKDDYCNLTLEIIE